MYYAVEFEFRIICIFFQKVKCKKTVSEKRLDKPYRVLDIIYVYSMKLSSPMLTADFLPPMK